MSDMSDLHEAIRAGDLTAADKLLRAGADPNGKDRLGYPALSVAAGRGEPRLTELLLTAGGDPLLLDTPMGASALHRAAQSGVVDVARLLLDGGAFIDLQAPTHGHTPLIDASWHKQPPMVRFLLERGADPEVRAHGGYDAAALLSESEVLPEISEAIETYRRTRRARDASPLRLAALRGDVEGVREAVRDGADVDEKAVDGHTPLLDAAREGHADAVAELLSAGASPRIVDRLMKATPGHKAAYMGHTQVARLLACSAELDLDAQGPLQRLHRAARRRLAPPRIDGPCWSKRVRARTWRVWTAARRWTWRASTATRRSSGCSPGATDRRRRKAPTVREHAPGLATDASAGSSTRASDFPDPDDEVLFPRLDEAQRARIAVHARRRAFVRGDTLFEQGMRDAPFFVLERGAVDFYDRRPESDRYFARCEAHTFVGDTAIFTGEPTIAACVAAEEGEALEMQREELRRLIADDDELGDLILRTMTARRQWLEGHGYGQIRLIGSRRSAETFALRDFLQRNHVPMRWHDVERDAESRELLDFLGVGPEETPVLVRTQGVLRKPTVATVAQELGLRARVGAEVYDLVVVGAGPAGLGAAVYAASEGLRTLVVEAFAPGGQAGTTSRIENYLGLPTGLSGAELAERAALQARKFGAILSASHAGARLDVEPGQPHRVALDDGQELDARAVVIATGAEYRRLELDGLERFEGSGVYYAATHLEAQQCAQEDVVVVGGGNSAGQAAVQLSRHARRVRMAIRGPSLAKTMSRYLVDRIERTPNIELLARTELRALHGDPELQAVTAVQGAERVQRTIDARAVFVMIGALPRTGVLRGTVGLDERGFVVTGEDAAAHEQFAAHWVADRAPYLLETTRPAVFAVGDVRSGSTKRVASAVGDGAMAVRYVHETLA